MASRRFGSRWSFTMRNPGELHPALVFVYFAAILVAALAMRRTLRLRSVAWAELDFGPTRLPTPYRGWLSL